VYISEVEGCKTCTLYEAGCRMKSKFTEVEGRGTFSVLVVAEASGEQENAAGLPRRPRAPAGSVFERVIRRMGWTRDNFRIANILRCRPPKNWLDKAPWERASIDHCRTNLDEVVETLKPKAILALGAIPLRELTGLSGEKLNVTYLRGYVLPSRYGIPVVPTFHPSYLGRGTMKYLGMVMRDVARAVTVAQRGLGPCLDLAQEIECRTDIADLHEIYERAKADPMLPVGVDLETDESAKEDEDEVVEFSRDLAESVEGDGDEDGYRDDMEEELDRRSFSHPMSGDIVRTSKIRTIQFAVDRSWGVSVPWEEGYRELAVAILALPNPKVWHNGDLFDSPVLKKHGAKVAGCCDDTLTMAKNLQPDLPAHLQAVSLVYRPELAPWKHLAGVNLELYGAIDAAVLIDIRSGLERDMRRLKAPNGVTVWDGYEKWTRPFRPILDEMSARGIPVDKPRLDELRSWLETEIERIDVELQGHIPDELRRGKLEEGCKAVPDDVKEWLRNRFADMFGPVLKTYKNGKTKEIKSKVKITDVYRDLMSDDEDWTMERTRICDDLGYAVREYSENGTKERRLVMLKGFNPGSPKQMIDYLKWKRYKVPTRFKDGQPTTGDKEMEKLYRQTKDPVIKLSRDKRATSKLQNGYTGKIDPDGVARGGWIPGSDGRLRATIKLTSATWQLKAQNPNTMTLPKRRPELAKKFRSCIRAEPGHRIVTLDMRAFHAKMTGREARDADWMRLSDLDIHSYVAGWMVKWKGMEGCLSLNDEDLKAFLRDIRAKHGDIRDFKAKPSILGVGFGMGYKRLYFENNESFASEGDAKKLLDLLKRLFPRVFKWQEDIVERADREGRLISNFGAIRWLWDAVAWRWQDGRWVKSNGSQAEQAKAFLPASHAHGMLRLKLIKMQEWGWLEKYELINIVHDEVVFHPRTEMAEECAVEVGRWLQAPVMELADPVVCPEGFVCACEAKVGEDLANMEEIRI
jgi:uracil-DNA glycosylase